MSSLNTRPPPAPPCYCRAGPLSLCIQVPWQSWERRAGRSFPDLSGRWQHCAADASSRRSSPTASLPHCPVLGFQAQVAAPPDSPDAAVLHYLQMVCAWQVTTGLNARHGAYSDLGVFVAPGVTVAWLIGPDRFLPPPLSEKRREG